MPQVPQRVSTSSRVCDALNALQPNEHQWAWLVGKANEASVHVYNVISSNAPSSVDIVLPAGVFVVGIALPQAADAGKALQNFTDKSTFKPVEGQGRWMVALFGNNPGGPALIRDEESKSTTQIPWEACEDSAGFESTLPFRLAFSHAFSCSRAPGLAEELKQFEKFLAGSDFAFVTQRSSTIFEVSGLRETGSSLGECTTLEDSELKSAGGRLEDRAIEITLLSNATSEKVVGPYLHFAPSGSQEHFCVRVDVLCLLPRLTAVRDMLLALLESAKRQFSHMGLMLMSGSATTVSAMHFSPHPLPHPITICYADGNTDNDKLREKWHRALALPEWPFLRLCNALKFHVASSGRLRNVHYHALASGVTGGKQTLVKGDYEYYHYLQDKFPDEGWGCAYRTFMTICSWFLLQGYTAVPVPDHRTIQTALVTLGEKPGEFIGSKQWIGSIELGFVLEHILGFQAKILPVNSGTEIPTKARELAEHFRLEGTPVMIGGGQFAYGLLGVDFNEGTGDVKFLILDPHYVGPEDIRTIVSKKWCAWRLADEVFDKNAFYNFCLPLRPRVI